MQKAVGGYPLPRPAPQPVVSVAYDPIGESLYWATKGGGQGWMGSCENAERRGMYPNIPSPLCLQRFEVCPHPPLIPFSGGGGRLPPHPPLSYSPLGNGAFLKDPRYAGPLRVSGTQTLRDAVVILEVPSA